MAIAIRPRAHRGTWLVIGLLLAAGVAGLGFTYRGALARVFSDRSDARLASTGGAADRAAAQRALEVLQPHVQAAIADQQIAAVLPALREFVERYPDYAPARTLLGEALAADRRFDLAYEQLQISLRLDPRQPAVQFLAGSLAAGRGRMDDAGRHYANAVGLDPKSATYRVHLAQIYIQQRDFDKARNLLLEALRLDSSLAEAYASLSDLYAQQGQVRPALDQLEKAIDLTPASQRDRQVAYLRRKARLLLRDNQPDDALRTLRNLTDPEQADPGVIEEMANCYAMRGEPVKGAELYERAMQTQPTDDRLVAGAARWRLRVNDRDGARRHLNLLRSIDPRSPAIGEIERQLR